MTHVLDNRYDVQSGTTIATTTEIRITFTIVAFITRNKYNDELIVAMYILPVTVAARSKA